MSKYGRRRGHRDQAARAALAPIVAAGLAVCWRCHLPIDPADQWDAGHVDDLATGGHPDGRRLPEHSRCNRSAGARLGASLRRPTRRRLADWLGFSDAGDRPEHPAPVHFSPKRSEVAPGNRPAATAFRIAQVI